MTCTRTISMLACALVLGASFATASAAERRVRLTVEVKIEGTEGVVGNGADRTGGKFREGYTLVTYLKSDGELAQFNTKDPEHAQKMMGLAAAVQQRTRGTSAAKKMKPEEFRDYMQKKQAACKGDQSCLYKLAMEAQQLAANIDKGTGSAGPAAYTGEEPPRYMTYFGYENCGATAHVYVDRTTQGTVGDTGGAVPYTIHDTAEYRNNATELGLICNFHQAILDTQDGSFYMDGAILPTAKGHSTMIMRGKTTQSDGEASTHGEAYTWINEQLRHVPRAGQRSTALKLTQNQGASIHSGRYTGEARIQLSWKFEDAK